jgi:ribosomal protein S19E (S16A)
MYDLNASLNSSINPLARGVEMQNSRVTIRSSEFEDPSESKQEEEEEVEGQFTGEVTHMLDDDDELPESSRHRTNSQRQSVQQLESRGIVQQTSSKKLLFKVKDGVAKKPVRQSVQQLQAKGLIKIQVENTAPTKGRSASGSKLFKVKGGVAKIPQAGPVGLEERAKAGAGEKQAKAGASENPTRPSVQDLESAGIVPAEFEDPSESKQEEEVEGQFTGEVTHMLDDDDELPESSRHRTNSQRQSVQQLESRGIVQQTSSKKLLFKVKDGVPKKPVRQSVQQLQSKGLVKTQVANSNGAKDKWRTAGKKIMMVNALAADTKSSAGESSMKRQSVQDLESAGIVRKASSKAMEAATEAAPTKDRSASGSKLFKVKGGVAKIQQAGPVGLEKQAKAGASEDGEAGEDGTVPKQQVAL